MDEEQLYRSISDYEDEPRKQGALLAELFVRQFLKPDQERKEFGDRYLLGSMEYFVDKMGFSPSERDLEGGLLKSSSRLAGFVQPELRRRMQLLLKSEGMIPVFGEGDSLERAYFIPFHFETSDGKENNAHYLKGQEIPEWSKYLSALEIKDTIVLHCHWCKAIPGLGGPSMMLPLQTAWWRHQRELPKYNPFQFIFTGAFDDKEQLCSVNARVKGMWIDKKLDEAWFIYPEDSGMDLFPGKKYELPRIKKNDLLGYLKLWIERKMGKINHDYALRRLPGLGKETRDCMDGDWDTLIQRLENFFAFPSAEPANKLMMHRLLAEAYCHKGETGEAEKHNDKAKEVAKTHGLEKENLRLDIDQLVLLQDNEKISEAFKNGKVLENQVETVGDLDLEMRFCGTMGQACMYGLVGGFPEAEKISPDDAREFLLKAKECAVKLDSPADIAQDHNYLVLWTALFRPEKVTEEAMEARIDVLALQEKETHACYCRNMDFLNRALTFGWYRNYLKTGAIPEELYPRIFDIKKTLNHADAWIRATIGKYLGTLLWAKGNQREAESLFSCAKEALGGKEKEILGFINMTVYAQAYHCAGKEEDRRKAMEILDGCREQYVNFKSFPYWREYLQEPREKEFPALMYWY